MIFNKSFSLVSNDVILSVAETLSAYPNNFLFSNYYSLNRNYFNYNNENIRVLKDIKCDIKMYANPFRRQIGDFYYTSYLKIRLEVERNGSIMTIINRSFNTVLQPIYELENIEFKENDIINCYAQAMGDGEIHSIAGYSLFLKE